MGSLATIEELYSCYLEASCNVSTDSRKPTPDSVFFALKGENFNANEFAQKALDAGCKYAVIDDKNYTGDPRIKLVSNTLDSLQQLAHHHRIQFSFPVLGITGSNGKTTNKELIHAVLSKKYQTLATFGNLNNHIGVPLTLLKIRKSHEFAIIEMGANHQGEIRDLCVIADPDYGMITNIGKAHLEGFGGVEGVIKGKTELYSHIKAKHGKVFLNTDDALLQSLITGIESVNFGTGEDNLISGKEISGTEKLSFKFKVKGDNRSWENLPAVQTQLIGNYNFSNCLAAACIGHYFSVPENEIRTAIEEYSPTMNRSQLLETGRNKLILDAYNANPNSMASAIVNFAKLPANNKLLFLGDMFELGEYSQEEHKKIIDLLLQNNFGPNQVILVGYEFSKLNGLPYISFKTSNDCKDYLAKNTISNSTILIKGSRGMKMEELKELF